MFLGIFASAMILIVLYLTGRSVPGRIMDPALVIVEEDVNASQAGKCGSFEFFLFYKNNY